ncbi:MAG TPA: short chain dehydrogenase [Pseudomonas sp.]|nr:short chain dehydrogenase [Pseudomonas sp.]
MSIKFSGQVALVTGGGAGIGRATALAFAAEGIRVMVSDIAVDKAEETVELIRHSGGEATFQRTDVTRSDEVAGLMSATTQRYGRLDYAFNNAGILIENGRLADGSESQFDAIMSVNVKGVWLCMKHQLPLMVAQGGGVIVNTASVTGLVGAPTTSLYSASKHAVIGLTKSAAIEYAKKNIRINAVCPSVTDTEMFQRTLAANPKAADFVAQIHPVGRIGKPEEVAAAVLYLCCDAAAFTTGHSLVVDGGATAI